MRSSKKTFENIAHACVFYVLIAVSLKIIFGDGLYFHHLIALGFPFVLYIPREFRNPAIVLICVASLMANSYLAIASILFTLAVYKGRTGLRILLIGCIFASPFILYATEGKPISELNSYLSHQSIAYEKHLTKNVLTGHGLGSFKDLKIEINGKWLKRMHSDYLQSIYEFGLLSIVITFLLLIPIFIIKDYREPLHIAYIILLVEYVIQFPFQRWPTLLLALLTLVLTYRSINGQIR